MNQCFIRVRYNGDCNAPLERNHKGILTNLIYEYSRNFPHTPNGVQDAVRFWYDCKSPITKIDEILGIKLVPRYKEVIEIVEKNKLLLSV